MLQPWLLPLRRRRTPNGRSIVSQEADPHNATTQSVLPAARTEKERSAAALGKMRTASGVEDADRVHDKLDLKWLEEQPPLSELSRSPSRASR